MGWIGSSPRHIDWHDASVNSGEIDLADLESWDLNLNENEEQATDSLLRSEISTYLTVNTGTKVEVKDWGEKRLGILIEQGDLPLP